MSKKWLLLFGILDILKIENVITLSTQLLKGEIVIHFLNVFGIVFCSTIVLTGILLIMNKRAGFILSYIEFPFRLLFAYFPFGFLLWINKIQVSDHIMIWTIAFAILETARLVLTIWIHKQEGKKAGARQTV